jgi:hypothetical protein
MWLVGLCRQECRCRAVVNVKTMYRLAVSCLVLASSFTPSHLLPVFFRYTAWGRDHQQSSCVFFTRCNRSSCALSFTISNLFYWRLHSHHHASYRKRRSLHTNDSRPCGSHTYRNFSFAILSLPGALIPYHTSGHVDFSLYIFPRSCIHDPII